MYQYWKSSELNSHERASHQLGQVKCFRTLKINVSTSIYPHHYTRYDTNKYKDHIVKPIDKHKPACNTQNIENAQAQIRLQGGSVHYT